jgi:hypothetical protein
MDSTNPKAAPAETDRDMEEKVWTGRDPLKEMDPEVDEIIRKEKHRQSTGLELIASEVGGCGVVGVAG